MLINSSEVNLKEAVMTETHRPGRRRGHHRCFGAESADPGHRASGHARPGEFFRRAGQRRAGAIDTNLVHYRGLRLVGTTGSTNSDYYKCLALVSEGRANLARLVTKTFSLDEINKHVRVCGGGHEGSEGRGSFTKTDPESTHRETTKGPKGLNRAKKSAG